MGYWNERAGAWAEASVLLFLLCVGAGQTQLQFSLALKKKNPKSIILRPMNIRQEATGRVLWGSSRQGVLCGGEGHSAPCPSLPQFTECTPLGQSYLTNSWFWFSRWASQDPPPLSQPARETEQSLWGMTKWEQNYLWSFMGNEEYDFWINQKIRRRESLHLLLPAHSYSSLQVPRLTLLLGDAISDAPLGELLLLMHMSAP